MTRDDVIRMAREVADKDTVDPVHGDPPFIVLTPDEMIQFAALVAAAEREACAKIAESYEPRCDTCPSGVTNAIRARGNTGIKWEIEP